MTLFSLPFLCSNEKCKTELLAGDFGRVRPDNQEAGVELYGCMEMDERNFRHRMYAIN